MKNFYTWILLVLGLFISLNQASAQSTDTLTVMHYNLLAFPGSNGTTRVNELRKIIRYTRPDILTVNEVNNASAINLILNSALNLDGRSYQASVYQTSANDTKSLVFYNTRKLALRSERMINRNGYPRNTFVYTLYPNQPGYISSTDTTFLRFYVVHLQASQGNETQRNLQATDIVNDLAAQSNRTRTFMNGDFNVYTSTEPAYQTLVLGTNAPFRDPINRPGNWNNNSTFAAIHTQSPRTTQFGGGANGGMDDRFDFIIPTPDVISGTQRVRYVPGSYKALGNDGNHFNGALTTLPNGVVPDSIALALHDMSDHLPVVMKIAVEQIPTGLSPQQRTTERLRLSGLNPEVVYWESEARQAPVLGVFDLNGRLVQSLTLEEGRWASLPALPNGTYLLRATSAQGQQVQRFIIAR